MQELIVVVDEITDFTSMNIEIIKRLDDEIGKVMQPFRLSFWRPKALTYLTSFYWKKETITRIQKL
jgi:glutamyl-tRNA synthetase